IANDVPLTIELLSPADRPIQITNDLPGFWAGSWVMVRKELAGRYPKHQWPVDPAAAPPQRLKHRPAD
ncbi:MAG: ATP-dependent helicase C-terminal domain-containing protein, partial [Ilumatobacteraceae bacterium]